MQLVAQPDVWPNISPSLALSKIVSCESANGNNLCCTQVGKKQAKIPIL